MKKILLGLLLMLLSGEARSQQIRLDTSRSNSPFSSYKTILPYSPLVSLYQSEPSIFLRADSVRTKVDPIRIPFKKELIYVGPTPPRNSIYLIRIKIK